MRPRTGQATEKQLEFFKYIKRHLEDSGKIPPYNEIVKQFNYKSPNSVTQNLAALRHKGYLWKPDGVWKLNPFDKCPTCGHTVYKHELT